ncbi:hypothetical protein Vadar_023277 [Vaccinium darrowii]|uniref:Uncharacterized protein n=1 Tax=Vaccinium darrowii TaxID=229202 RepID=A0ACB7YHN8_9ERIC|nr:hypothetical protein Vadar_023277 [Vaccinium darrowii]
MRKLKIEAEKNEERTESFFLTDLAPLSSTKMTMLVELEPGPIDDSVLTRQASHRSARVWDLNGLEESVALTCRRRELSLSRVAIDPRLLPLIEAAGFTGLMKVPFIQLDWHLMQLLRGNPKWKGKGKEESSLGLHLRPRIPGPAGVLQEAMERRATGKGVKTMNTQEFLHRALTVESEDTDFVDNSAWLTAMRQGYLQDPKYTDLATVNKMSNLKRVPLVVTLVKSCVRNQLGEPLLELKDPTGSVWASIHWKAYDEELFPGILKVGTYIILKEIVIFRPTRKSLYLNITLANLQSVIEKSMLD